MTAKIENTEVTRQDWQIVAYPVLTGQKIFKWTPTMALASGSWYAYTNDWTTKTLTAGDVFLWISIEEVDNTTWDSWDADVRVYTTWAFELVFSDTLTQANIWAKVYVNNVTDDSVVTITSDTWNAEVCIGFITKITWANSAFVEINKCVWNIVDTVAGGVEIPDNSISTAKIVNVAVTTAKIADNAVTNAKMADDAIKQAELDYEIVTIQITWAASWTWTCTTWSIILWHNVTDITWSETLKTLDVSWTTVTAVLSWSDTATIKVAMLKA